MEGVSMTSPLPGYGSGLTDDLILGYITWYTVTKPRLTHEQIRNLVLDLNLDKSIVPKAPRAGDAFKRACRYSETSGVPIPLTNDVANFMFRPVAQTLEDIERHLIVEVLDPQGRKLSHHTAVMLRFRRDTGILNATVDPINSDLDPLVKEVMEGFAATLKESTLYIEAQVIRRMIRMQLDKCNAILARSKGSVYFVPKKYKDKMEGLESFLTHCGTGSGMHWLPLVDDTKQQAFITNVFQEGVHEQATQVLSELKSYTTEQKEISPNKWNDYKEKLMSLVDKANEYSDLVDSEFGTAETELEAVKAHLDDLLLSGLITEK
jgi:hypothetical protein